ncbi:UNVERIFIED_ORG: PAS domain S-box-containing protein [Rhizobium sp. SORGH_AS260]|nr:PAS domain S-box-containing protein [Rhizobium sp. SORGH_AS_0285]MDP9752512.1 PAS domain S-box-containing protein [Rhizobium sp. SORGH_AS_0260]MDR6079474.1 PAS domain S-box-containing protein [Agrobacterium sp. SORGH_AS_0440]
MTDSQQIRTIRFRRAYRGQAARYRVVYPCLATLGGTWRYKGIKFVDARGDMDDSVTIPKINRLVLQNLVTGLSDGLILLENDGTIAWANRAALVMHRIESVSELGDDTESYRRNFTLRYRNNHLLDAGQYPLERLLAGETFEDVTVEISPSDDETECWVHTVRGLILEDAGAKPDVLVLIIRDETPRYEAEARFESAFNANPAPGLICRLEDQRFIRVNQGFLEMTGFSREDIIGISVEELGLFSECDTGEDALKRLHEGRVIRQREALIPIPGGDRLVIVAGETIAVAEEPCMLFTFADLDGRRKAQNALRQSEERFFKSFRLSPAPAAISRLEDFVLTEVNDAFLTLCGRKEAEVVGKTASELKLWDDVAARRDVEKRLKDNIPIRNENLRMNLADGSAAECIVSAERAEINDQLCVIWAIQDVTERRRSENELIEAIESVMADTSWFSRTVVERLAGLRQNSRGASSSASLKDLTEREEQILSLICDGCSDKEMSDRLNLSRHTIRNHIASLYGKIGVNRRTAAVIWARERGFAGRR